MLHVLRTGADIRIRSTGDADYGVPPRALEGNFLSWFYTFEWPILGCVAFAGWWHLVHEDPEKYRRREAGLDDWDVPESERVE